MDLNFFVAFGTFALVSSITPGPNNIMLMASGANFGFRCTLPHMLGVGLGFSVMVWLVGAGLMRTFERIPNAYNVLHWLSVGYLLFLAYKIANASHTTESSKQDGQPISFFQAAAFQWINPKAWVMALTGISVYAPERNMEMVMVVAVVFGLVNIPSISVWVLLGQNIQRFLKNPQHLKMFNYIMASLLVLSLLPML